jgi:hypothetical protein
MARGKALNLRPCGCPLFAALVGENAVHNHMVGCLIFLQAMQNHDIVPLTGLQWFDNVDRSYRELFPFFRSHEWENVLRILLVVKQPRTKSGQSSPLSCLMIHKRTRIYREPALWIYSASPAIPIISRTIRRQVYRKRNHGRFR